MSGKEITAPLRHFCARGAEPPVRSTQKKGAISPITNFRVGALRPRILNGAEFRAEYTRKCVYRELKTCVSRQNGIPTGGEPLCVPKRKHSSREPGDNPAQASQIRNGCVVLCYSYFQSAPATRLENWRPPSRGSVATTFEPREGGRKADKNKVGGGVRREGGSVLRGDSSTNRLGSLVPLHVVTELRLHWPNLIRPR